MSSLPPSLVVPRVSAPQRQSLHILDQIQLVLADGSQVSIPSNSLPEEVELQLSLYDDKGTPLRGFLTIGKASRTSPSAKRSRDSLAQGRFSDYSVSSGTRRWVLHQNGQGASPRRRPRRVEDRLSTAVLIEGEIVDTLLGEFVTKVIQTSNF